MVLDGKLGRLLTALAGSACVALAMTPAHAALGDDLSSAGSDSAHMKAQLRAPTTTGAGYTVQAMSLPSGTIVREYAAPDGRVFAVTWRGPSAPDLRQTFGTYFQQYVDAAKKTAHGAAARRHFQVHASDLVVVSNGRMRAFSGLAYVPSLVPPGVSISELQ